MRRLLATLLSLGLATACRTAPPTAPEAAAAAPRPLRHVSAAECGRCHEAIYREWHASMHARANPLRDPIHGALYRKMVGDPTAEGVREHGHPPHCPACHVPAAALDHTTRLDARPVYLEGVTCTTCHTLTGLRPGGESRGVHSYTRSDERLQGRGHTGPASALYPMAAAGAWLGSSELCLGCHGSHRNPKGVPVCRTGEEARQGGGGITCQACHMPVVDGHASHAMLGGHSEAMVARGATVALRTAGGELRVELRNRTGHAFPTGAPFRSARLVVEGTDAAGRVVWRAAQGLAARFTDAVGRPAPPPRASRLAADTRLAPAEVRELSFQVPPAVVRVRARLVYRLLPPKMAQQVGRPEAAEPKVVAVAEAALR